MIKPSTPNFTQIAYVSHHTVPEVHNAIANRQAHSATAFLIAADLSDTITLFADASGEQTDRWVHAWRGYAEALFGSGDVSPVLHGDEDVAHIHCIGRFRHG